MNAPRRSRARVPTRIKAHKVVVNVSLRPEVELELRRQAARVKLSVSLMIELLVLRAMAEHVLNGVA